ncbi:MAG TPA: hypothetical protein IAD15_10045 [Candidatus Fimiplasma intestinipullorum]|uniref:Uncharacterized protein n=1 Tax=Candidatus Fimiplasma intestinipullorum TaxID=2840825 RepID=A0A9D1HR40_9FIRM|nr:hypothetical protein [Candidatus Fimiplasma intestinipullorum]
MISDKIKDLLKIKKCKAIAYSNALGLNKETALYTKYNRQSFKVQDLIILGELTNTKLAFIDDDNNPVVLFDTEDLKK